MHFVHPLSTHAASIPNFLGDDFNEILHRTQNIALAFRFLDRTQSSRSCGGALRINHTIVFCMNHHLKPLRWAIRVLVHACVV